MQRRTQGLAAVTMIVAVALVGCSDGGEGGGGGPVLGDDAIRSAEVVAMTEGGQQPVDATPSPDGTVIYYVATGEPSGTVFSVPAHGGAVAKLAEGAPLAAPSGISASLDGGRLFVADARSGGTGAVLSLPATASEGVPAVVPGTEGRAPRGLDVVRARAGEVVFFTGTNPTNGAPGLFRVPAIGGTVITVAEGAPFVSPDSVVVSGDGTAYVSDQGAGAGKGLVFRVADGPPEPVLKDLTLGAPAGVTLIHGESTLLVSSIDASSRSDQVLFLDVANGRTAAATKVIGANKNSAGGLHRAHDAAVLAWADIQRPGRVYRVDI